MNSIIKLSVKRNVIQFCILRCKGTVTTKEKNVKIIKKVNYENKALFGAVIKEKKKKSTAIKHKKIVDFEEVNSNENDMSSEIFWLGQKHQIPFEEILTRDNPKIEISDATILEKVSLTKKARKTKATEIVVSLESVEKFQSLLLPSSKIHRKSKILENINKINDIPFDNDTLKNMINFPLDIRNEKKNIQEINPEDINLLPSVGKILQATMSDSARKGLMQWKMLKIAELGLEKFEELQKSHLQQGKQFHSSLEEYFNNGKEPDKTSSVYETWNSVNSVLQLIKPTAELIEAPIYHPVLKYKGIVDCVAMLDSDLYIIEWKKSDRQKLTITSTYDAPIQLCAYLGAILCDSRYNLNITKGAVVIAYTNGSPAHLYKLNSLVLKQYWKQYLYRLQEYWIRYRDNTLPEPI